MRILITGATGFIGARLACRLSADGYDVRILRRAASKVPIGLTNFEEILGDITLKEDVRRAVEGCDVVFHLAASVSYWEKERDLQYNANVSGTKNIVEACLEYNVRRLIHTSSIVAIGMSKNKSPADEDAEYNLWPLKIGYCDTKHLAEMEVQKGITRGLDAVIVNPAAVFGPGDDRRFKGRLFGGTVFRNLFYVGGGIATVDVDDVVEGHIRAWKMGKAGNRYILANENLTFYEIGKMVSEARGSLMPKIKIPTPVVFLIAYLSSIFSDLIGIKPFATIPMAQFTRVNLFFSNQKACRELGISFRPFRETIKRATEYFDAPHLAS